MPLACDRMHAWATTNGQRVGGAPEPSAVEARSLRQRVMRGAVWSGAGFGLAYALRFGSNLVLTRILFPQAFGLMALANVFVQGLAMFSDVGIGPSLVQHPRGGEPAFRNTAWTIQAARGAILTLACWLLAGGLWCYNHLLHGPISGVYADPQLPGLVAALGLTALFGGLNSTALFVANRQLLLRRLVILDLSVQALAILVMVAGAWIFRSVWALAVGSILASVVRMAASHRILPGHRDRLYWEREAARALFGFGKWIFVSTIITFLVAQGDRLILGGFMSAAELGVYSIAFALAMLPVEALRHLSNSVLFPTYSLLSQRSPEELVSKMRRMRLLLMVGSVPLLATFSVLAYDIIGWLYDSRYAEGGWFLRVLSAGAIPAVVILTSSPVLLARGDSLRFMILQLARAVILVTTALLGGYLWGTSGLVVAVAMVSLLTYPVAAWAVRKHGVRMLGLDVAAMAGGGALIVLGWLVRGGLGG